MKANKMEFIKLTRSLASILGLTLWLGATANTFASESGQIEEVVVQASLLHNTTDEGMTTLHLLNQNQLKSMPVLSLGSSLENLLGVTVADYGSGVGQLPQTGAHLQPRRGSAMGILTAGTQQGVDARGGLR